MIKGTLKFFSTAKGFGFITPDGDGKDVFLPAATITACGAPKMLAGQRVSFEQEADVKGPKAVRLVLLDEKPKVAPAPAPMAAPSVSMTLYCDPNSSETADVLAALDAAGHQPRLADYTVTPPARDELQRLSLVLRDADQSLVRRYHPLFLDLQLDDRFISESEFWTAIVEHPSLINGPVLVEGGKARICKTAGDIRAFLGLNGRGDVQKAPKELSPRMAAMIRGQAVPPAPERAPALAPAPKHIEKSPAPTAKPSAAEPIAAKAVAAKPVAVRPVAAPKPAPKKSIPAPAKKATKAPAKKAKAPVTKKLVVKKKKR